MRGAVSVVTVVLFLAFAAALAVLAFIVDTQAQRVLELDTQTAASSAADFVASQVRDAVTSGAVPGVALIEKALLIPHTFYGFDTASASVCIGNSGGNIYVNVTLATTRGTGSAYASATSWVFNVTSWALTNGKGVYLRGSFGHCPNYQIPQQCIVNGMLDLASPGCAALIDKASIFIITR
jgi:hypothetical protein